MRKFFIVLSVLLLIVTVSGTVLAYPYAANTRIKDIAKIQGVRSNQLLGYGLVVGLSGTGDSTKSTFTLQSIVNMLKGFGVNLSAADAASLKAKNVAAVMVTAQLPAFVKPGDTIDINVSSMGDAKSLQGGTLLQTPLKAANGNVYAVGQGPISIGGYSASSGGSSQQKNFLTVASVPSGAIVERDVVTQFSGDGTIALALNNPDFTTANRMAEAIATQFGSISTARDPGTVVVSVPAEYTGNLVGFIAALEEISVVPDTIAKVVINERTGTVVMGTNVTIDEVAVAQGGLSVKITRDVTVSQPQPFSGGNTVISGNTSVNVKEPQANLIVLPASTNVGDVVDALNAVGATPRDIISILQAMKAAGALHAELQII